MTRSDPSDIAAMYARGHYTNRDCAIIRRQSTPGNLRMELGQIGLKIDDLKERCGALRGYL